MTPNDDAENPPPPPPSPPDYSRLLASAKKALSGAKRARDRLPRGSDERDEAEAIVFDLQDVVADIRDEADVDAWNGILAAGGGGAPAELIDLIEEVERTNRGQAQAALWLNIATRLVTAINDVSGD